MSPEEMQVVIGEWMKWIGAASDDLYDLKKDASNAEEGEYESVIDNTVDTIAKVQTVLTKVLTDMNKASWSHKDREAAFTLVAGYVTQSNVERQKRRDEELIKHKMMMDKAFEQRLIDGLAAAERRARTAEEQEIIARSTVEEHKQRLDIDYYARLQQMSAALEEQVAEEVALRLMGDTTSTTPGRRKRPLVIG